MLDNLWCCLLACPLFSLCCLLFPLSCLLCLLFLLFPVALAPDCLCYLLGLCHWLLGLCSWLELAAPQVRIHAVLICWDKRAPQVSMRALQITASLHLFNSLLLCACWQQSFQLFSTDQPVCPTGIRQVAFCSMFQPHTLLRSFLLEFLHLLCSQLAQALHRNPYANQPTRVHESQHSRHARVPWRPVRLIWSFWCHTHAVRFHHNCHCCLEPWCQRPWCSPGDGGWSLLPLLHHHQSVLYAPHLWAQDTNHLWHCKFCACPRHCPFVPIHLVGQCRLIQVVSVC